MAPAAPVGQMVEDSPERREQVPVDFVGNQLDDPGLDVAGGKVLDGRTAENAGPGSRVQDADLVRLGGHPRAP